MPPIPVALINWNAIEMTERCLRCLNERTDRSRIAITVVDNGSRDPANQERLAILRAEGLLDHVVLAGENLGFSGGFNLAMERTVGEIFCYLSNDCLVEPGWLDAGLRALATDPRVAGVCSNVYEEEGRRRVVPDRELRQLYGPIMFIRRAAWDAVGPFDAANFSPAYSEELDWSYRAIRKGYILKLAGGSLAHHVGGYSCGKNVPRADIHLIRLTHRIKCRLFNWPLGRLCITAWPLYCREVLAEVRNGTLPILARAWWKNLTQMPAILAERRRRLS